MKIRNWHKRNVQASALFEDVDYSVNSCHDSEGNHFIQLRLKTPEKGTLTITMPVAECEQLIGQFEYYCIPAAKLDPIPDPNCPRCEGEGQIHDADFSDGDSDHQMYLMQDTLRPCPKCCGGKE